MPFNCYSVDIMKVASVYECFRRAYQPYYKALPDNNPELSNNWKHFRKCCKFLMELGIFNYLDIYMRANFDSGVIFPNQLASKSALNRYIKFIQDGR